MDYDITPFNINMTNDNRNSIDLHQISFENNPIQAKIKEYQNKYLVYTQSLFSNISLIYLQRISLKAPQALSQLPILNILISICKKLMLNEFEIMIWGNILEKMNWSHNGSNFDNYALSVALVIKVHMNKNSVLNPILEFINSENATSQILFHEIFKEITGKIYQYSLLELNQIYMEFNKKGDNIEICDYNSEVDEILKLTKSTKPQTSAIINNLKVQCNDPQAFPSTVFQSNKCDSRFEINNDNISKNESTSIKLNLKFETFKKETKEKKEIKESINLGIIKNEQQLKPIKEVQDSNASKIYLYNDEMPTYLKDQILKRTKENPEVDPYSIDYLNSYMPPSPKFSNIYSWEKYSNIKVEENDNEVFGYDLDNLLGFERKNKKIRNFIITIPIINCRLNDSLNIHKC